LDEPTPTVILRKDQTKTLPQSLQPRLLKFQVDKQMESEISKTLEELNTEIAAHDVQVLAYTRFGKSQIKQLALSPDSFVQMAIQLGYAMLMNGTSAATYESAGMRRYAWGRTETCRSVSEASVRFVDAMCGDRNEEMSIDEKAAALRDAVATHSKTMGACLQGGGIDRHFLGLR
jgi:carnitine O-acetyltransferase